MEIFDKSVFFEVVKPCKSGNCIIAMIVKGVQMKIYVEEFPDKVTQQKVRTEDDGEILNCVGLLYSPNVNLTSICSLADREKEIRKEICDEISTFFMKNFSAEIGKRGNFIIRVDNNKFNKLLDRIKRGE